MDRSWAAREYRQPEEEGPRLGGRREQIKYTAAFVQQAPTAGGRARIAHYGGIVKKIFPPGHDPESTTHRFYRSSEQAEAAYSARTDNNPGYPSRARDSHLSQSRGFIRQHGASGWASPGVPPPVSKDEASGRQERLTPFGPPVHLSAQTGVPDQEYGYASGIINSGEGVDGDNQEYGIIYRTGEEISPTAFTEMRTNAWAAGRAAAQEAAANFSSLTYSPDIGVMEFGEPPFAASAPGFGSMRADFEGRAPPAVVGYDSMCLGEQRRAEAIARIAEDAAAAEKLQVHREQQRQLYLQATAYAEEAVKAEAAAAEAAAEAAAARQASRGTQRPLSAQQLQPRMLSSAGWGEQPPAGDYHNQHEPAAQQNPDGKRRYSSYLRDRVPATEATVRQRDPEGNRVQTRDGRGHDMSWTPEISPRSEPAIPRYQPVPEHRETRRGHTGERQEDLENEMVDEVDYVEPLESNYSPDPMQQHNDEYEQYWKEGGEAPPGRGPEVSPAPAEGGSRRVVSLGGSRRVVVVRQAPAGHGGGDDAGDGGGDRQWDSQRVGQAPKTAEGVLHKYPSLAGKRRRLEETNVKVLKPQASAWPQRDSKPWTTEEKLNKPLSALVGGKPAAAPQLPGTFYAGRGGRSGGRGGGGSAVGRGSGAIRDDYPRVVTAIRANKPLRGSVFGIPARQESFSNRPEATKKVPMVKKVPIVKKVPLVIHNRAVLEPSVESKLGMSLSDIKRSRVF